MKDQIVDRKNGLIYAFWSRINKIAIASHFDHVEVFNRELIPADRPFILVSNHTSRWDGLLVYRLINRPSNFMVHPNELLGFQGTVLKSMGAFPASARLDLLSHIKRQLTKGEGIVIFPEGDIHRDGVTHKFKSGAARFALNLANEGEEVPIVPVAIRYSEDGKRASIMVAPPISPSEYLSAQDAPQNSAIKALTDRLQREVSHLCLSLGARNEALQLFTSKPRRGWAGGADGRCMASPLQ
jgi:1-acyl-sn-glycerol-3-phosphate acyltransferase